MSTMKQDRQRAVKQTLASWAIEGFKPDIEYCKLLEHYINGEITLAQISERIDVAYGVPRPIEERE